MSHNPFTPRQRALKLAQNALANARVAERQFKHATKVPGKEGVYQRRFYLHMYEESLAEAFKHREYAHGKVSPYGKHVDAGKRAARKLATRVRKSR